MSPSSSVVSTRKAPEIERFQELFLCFHPEMLQVFCFSRNVPQMSRKVASEQHLVHYLSQPVHVTVQRMAVHIQRRTNITMTQPHLNVLGVTATLAQSIHSGMSQVC